MIIIIEKKNIWILFGLSLAGALGLWYLNIYTKKQKVLAKMNAFEQLNYIVKMQIRETINLLGLE